MNREGERGFALPIVVSVLMILVFLSFFLVSQLVRHKQASSLYFEMMEAQYAAESGIAFMQENLRKKPEMEQNLYYHWNGYYVTTKVTDRSQLVELESKAIGRQGVKQTIRVKLDPKTLAIREWLK